MDVPNDLIYKFQGAFHTLDQEEKFIKSQHSIDLENSMWAQSTLTKGEIYGMVIYSGADTKLMMSRVKANPKRSKVDMELNHISKVLFCFMFVASLFLIFVKGFGNGWMIQFFRYILLLCSIIPISMKVN